MPPCYEFLGPHPPQSSDIIPSAVPIAMPGYATVQSSYEYFLYHRRPSNPMRPSALPNTVPGYVPGYTAVPPPIQHCMAPHPSHSDYMIPSALPILPALGLFKYPTASLEGMPSEIKLEILHALHDLPSLRLLKLASREYYLTARTHVRSLAAAYQGTYHPEGPWPRFDEVIFKGQLHSVSVL